MSLRGKSAATLAAALTIGALAAPSVGAQPTAATSGNASCVAAGSSALAPGSGIEPFAFPGARADVAHFGQTQGTPGQFIKPLAQQKGTAIECFPTGPPGS